MWVLMTDLLAPEQHETVVEVGTGLGYQTGVLAELAGHVRSIEIVEEFADSARERLAQPGYKNVGIWIGGGSRGWPAHPIRQDHLCGRVREGAGCAARTA